MAGAGRASAVTDRRPGGAAVVRESGLTISLDSALEVRVHRMAPPWIPVHRPCA